jgi:hypothetical protein
MCFSTRVRPASLLAAVPAALALALLAAGCGGTPDGPASDAPAPIVVSGAEGWTARTADQEGVQVRRSRDGGRFDVLGDGALLLRRPDSAASFWHGGRFVEAGTWSSGWIDASALPGLDALEVEVLVYGERQDLSTGWTKFEGNPLVSGRGFRHATGETLQLPDTVWSNDQALVRGTGPYAGRWLLVFNVGSWAVGGWAAAVADSLAPLKRGKNPFRLVDPFPLFDGNAARDTLGYHAPNDFIHVDGTWYAPDESRDGVSRMWTADSLTAWTNHGPIQNVRGHDPGMIYDGDRFYLFNEDGERLQALVADDPLGRWTQLGAVLDVGDHTGDADPAFFNNAWHLFFDDAPHLHYQIGTARTAPEDFPRGWTLTNDIFGPRRPDQGQQWDEDTPAGNRFGTGDADVAVEGTTLYMTYERPTGIAYREFDLTDDREQSVRARIEVDVDGDGTPDTIRRKTLRAPRSRIALEGVEAEQVRVRLELETQNPRESPMVSALRLLPSGA